MTSADVELKHAWREFEKVPFPEVAGRTALVDLAGFDAFIAGIVMRVARGTRIPDEWRDEFRPDVKLHRRIAELHDAAAIQYVERLENLIGLARRAHASKSSANGG